jgi:hypothetical protein
MAGGGIKAGMVHGETDDFSYNIVRDPVHVRDFAATLLHQFGYDHQRFSYKFQGLDHQSGKYRERLPFYQPVPLRTWPSRSIK